eukprot:9668635-Ditylum_brightwellii.AAC.1
MLDDDDKDVDWTFNVETNSSLVDVLHNLWESNEYKTLFGMRSSKQLLGETLNEILDILENGMSGSSVGVVLRFESESDIEHITAYAQSRVPMKSTYLTIAIECALCSYYTKQKMIWSECRQKSIDTMKHIPMGLAPIVRSRTVMD